MIIRKKHPGLAVLMLLMAGIITLFSHAIAKDDPLPVIKTKAGTLAVFKNGLGFFVRSGELSIKNAKAEDITMEIKKRLTGEVLEKSHGGKVTKVAEGLRGVNFRSAISWELPVGAGEEVTITYSYKVYIRH